MAQSKIDPVPGVFRVTNKTTGRTYVGFARNLQRRIWDLKDNARHGRGAQKLLREDFQRYGVDDFEFVVLESNVPIEKLSELREYYAEKYGGYKTGYNHSKGHTYALSEAQRQSIAKSRKAAWDAGKASDPFFGLQNKRTNSKAFKLIRTRDGRTWNFPSFTAAARAFLSKEDRLKEAHGDPEVRQQVKRTHAIINAYFQGNTKVLNLPDLNKPNRKTQYQGELLV